MFEHLDVEAIGRATADAIEVVRIIGALTGHFALSVLAAPVAAYDNLVPVLFQRLWTILERTGPVIEEADAIFSVGAPGDTASTEPSATGREVHNDLDLPKSRTNTDAATIFWKTVARCRRNDGNLLESAVNVLLSFSPFIITAAPQSRAMVGTFAAMARVAKHPVRTADRERRPRSRW